MKRSQTAMMALDLGQHPSSNLGPVKICQNVNPGFFLNTKVVTAQEEAGLPLL